MVELNIKQTGTRVTTDSYTRNEQLNHHKQERDENKTNSKIMWKILEGLISDNNFNSYIELEYEDSTYTDKQQIVNVFNEYFIKSIV